MIEGDHQHLVYRLGRREQIGQAVDQAFGALALLDLDQQAQARRSRCCRQRLGQRRHDRASKAG